MAGAVYRRGRGPFRVITRWPRERVHEQGCAGFEEVVSEKIK